MNTYHAALLEVRATLENPVVDQIAVRACKALQLIDAALGTQPAYSGLEGSYRDRMAAIKRATGTSLARMLVADLALRIEHIDGENELNVAGRVLDITRNSQTFVNYQAALLAYVRSMM